MATSTKTKGSDITSLEHLSTLEMESELERRKQEMERKVVPTMANTGKLREYNLALRDKVRRLPRGFDLEKELGFRAAYVLPVMLSYTEQNQIARRKQEIVVPQARDMQLTFRRSRIGPAGLFEEPPEKIVLDIMPVSGLPPDTTRGKHITAGYTSEDALRAIFADPNWCVCYFIFQMSEDEVADADRIEQSDEYREARERRERILAEGAEQSAVSGVLDRV